MPNPATPAPQLTNDELAALQAQMDLRRRRALMLGQRPVDLVPARVPVLPPVESATYREAPTDHMPMYDYLGEGGRGMAKPGPGMMLSAPPTKLEVAPPPVMRPIPNWVPPAEASPEDQAIQSTRDTAENNRLYIQKHGYRQALSGATYSQAAKVIADQLQLRRARMGDPYAFQALNPTI